MGAYSPLSRAASALLELTVVHDTVRAVRDADELLVQRHGASEEGRARRARLRVEVEAGRLRLAHSASV